MKLLATSIALFVPALCVSTAARAAESSAAAPATPPPAAADAKAPAEDSAAGLWKKIISIQLLHPVSKEEAERQKGIPLPERSKNAQALCKELIEKFPNSPERWEAEVELIDLRRLAGQMKIDTFTFADASKAYGDLLANQALPDTKRPIVLMRKLVTDVMSQPNPTPEDTKKFATELGEGVDKFGLPPFQMVLRVAMSKKAYLDACAESPNAKLKEAVADLRVLAEIAELQKTGKSDPDKAFARLKELKGSQSKDVAAAAERATKAIQTELDLASKPIELTFTSVDGRPVDLASMRGKVVLIDFWATWCGPCMAEVPHVVETYQKLHDQGFEIVGISLDNEDGKNKLEAVTKAKGMVWPQYFDGKGWKNELAVKYGIQAIPAMWLVNKQGMVVDTNGRQDLATKVAKLLAE